MNIKMNSLENMAFLVRSKIHNSKPWFNAIDTSPDSFSKIKMKPTLRKIREYGLLLAFWRCISVFGLFKYYWGTSITHVQCSCVCFVHALRFIYIDILINNIIIVWLTGFFKNPYDSLIYVMCRCGGHFLRYWPQEHLTRNKHCK